MAAAATPGVFFGPGLMAPPLGGGGRLEVSTLRNSLRLTPGQANINKASGGTGTRLLPFIYLFVYCTGDI